MTTSPKKSATPMTIIAIFATLSETSAAVSLPFLDFQERQVYVWFLITFPFFLILLFFATLNFNYKSLYAPSDFEKGKHFIKIIDEKLKQENLANSSTANLPDEGMPSNYHNSNFYLPERLRKQPPQHPEVHYHKDHYSSGNAQDPPAHVNLFAGHGVQHILNFPRLLYDLHIVDTRWISTKKEADELMHKVEQKIQKSSDTGYLIVFLTNQKSAKLMTQSDWSTANEEKHKRHPYISYNLNNFALTLSYQANG